MKTPFLIPFLFVCFAALPAHATLCFPKYIVKDDVVLLWPNKPLPDIDAKTFQALDECGSAAGYAKDKNNTYYLDNILKGADPQTFVAVAAGLAHDKNNVYWNGEIIPDATAEGFQHLSYAYWNGAVPLHSWKNSQHVYIGTNIISGADPKSFEMASSHELKADKVRYWKKGKSISYVKDKQHAYWQDKLIEGAHPESFETFTVPNLSMMDRFYTYRMSTSYAKDAEHVFRHEKIVPGADPVTFVPTDYEPAVRETNNIPLKGQVSPSTANKKDEEAEVPAQAPKEGPPQAPVDHTHAEEWFKCQADNECTMVSGNCFNYLSVNKTYVDEFKKMLVDKVAPAACPKRDFAKPTVPKCIKNTCVVTDPSGETVYLYQVEPLSKTVPPAFHRVEPSGENQ